MNHQTMREMLALRHRPLGRIEVERMRADEAAAARHRSLVEAVKRALRPWGQPDRIITALAAASFYPVESHAADLGAWPDAMLMAVSIAALALGIVVGWCIAWAQVWHARREADRETDAVIARIAAMQSSPSAPVDYIRERFDGESA